MMQEYARISYAEMAKRLGVAESTIRYRVRRLLDSQIISKITILVNPRKIGFNVSAVVLVKVDPRHLTEVLKGVASFDETHHVFQSTGEYDIINVVHVRDMKALNEFKQRVKMLRGVKDVVVWVTTELVKISTNLPI